MVIHPKTLDRAVKLITKFEGVETEAYQDPQGIATICTGLTKYPNGDIVRIGDVCKASICYQYTKDLIQEESLEYIKNIPGWERLGHRRQASLLSFGWNKGFSVYKTEEFEPIQAILKASIDYPERYEEMSEVLSLYATDQGQESAALLNRRSIEGSEWDKESVKSLYFRAKRDTYLKKAALDYIWLADQAKKKIEEDEIIQVSQSREIPNDLHNWLWIYGISGEWAVYMPDLELLTSDISTCVDIDWTDLNYPLGKYLTVGEVIQYDPRNAPEKSSLEAERLLRLAEEFNAVREAWNGPLWVTGGFRLEPFNREIGGVANSIHSRGEGLDICPGREDIHHLFNWLKGRWTGKIDYQPDHGYLTLDISNNGGFVGIR